jgi:hypothetical protein
MNDDDFLQEVDIYDGKYLPQLPPEKEQAIRLENEGFLSSFRENTPPDFPTVILYRLTDKGKARVPRYR